MSGVAPLVVRVEPIPGESLLSLVARAAHANVFPKLNDFLGLAGIGGHPAFTPFTAVDRAQALAELLDLPMDEVASRFHPLHPDQRLKRTVVWSGVRMRRRSIEAKVRRVAPLALKTSPHHRLEWTHRALSFCPETLEQLISACPACDADLGWVTTKGLDRCERCEASLTEADAPTVKTRSPDRLSAAAGLISPDRAVRAAAQARLPAEFHAWDAGDLFATLCEIGMAWRRSEEGRGAATARAVSDGSHRFQPEDIARGQTLLSDWPQLQGELLDRLAAGSSAHRSSGRLTSGHLGMLGRHLTPVSTGPTLGGLLMRAVDAEAEGRRVRAERAKVDQASLEERKVGSIGLLEACKAFEISRTVLKRLVPHGRSLIAVKSRRQGGVRFDAEKLAATAIAFGSCESFSGVSRALNVPRYCLPALIDAGVLDPCEDPDVELLFGESAVTARSVSGVRRRLETLPSRRQTTFCLRSLGAYLRRRFDPVVWAAALRLTLDDERVHRLTLPEGGGRMTLIDRVFVHGDMLGALLPPEDCKRIDARVRLSAREAGRLLGLSSPHLPELVEAGLLRGERRREGWTYGLSDVTAFHRAYVTASELRQRLAGPVTDLDVDRLAWGEEPDSSTKLSDYGEVVSTRHFALVRRAELEEVLEWPDPTLN